MKKFNFIIIICSLLLLLGTFTIVNQKADPTNQYNIHFVVQPNATGAQIISDLRNTGLVNSSLKTKLLMKLTNASQHIQAGTYNLSPSMTLWEIIRTIQGKGETSSKVYASVTIPEGLTVIEIAELLDSSGVAKKQEFLDHIQHLASIKNNRFKFLEDVPISTIEGYLFPDTYVLSQGNNSELVVEMMLTRFQEKALPLYKMLNSSQYSLHEILTIASIIEKEAVADHERPVVSSVFHNRLKYRMHLASCPTVKYALGNPKKPALYFKDLKVKSPYNTYQKTGLPPGPICSPGEKSIIAALSPANTKYLYFAAKGDGSNIFTKSYQEHYRTLARLGYSNNDITPSSNKTKEKTDKEIQPAPQKEVPSWYQGT